MGRIGLNRGPREVVAESVKGRGGLLRFEEVERTDPHSGCCHEGETNRGRAHRVTELLGGS